MNKIKGLMAIGAFGLLILGLPAMASAQWNGGYGGNGGYGRDDGYYGNGRYPGRGRYNNIRSTIQSLKIQARNFERTTDRASDRISDRRDDDRWGGWGNIWGDNNNRNNRGNRIDRIENLADEFAKATDRLADRYGNGRNLNNSADEAHRVLDLASRIDRLVYNSRSYRGNIQHQWDSIRRNVEVVANVYGHGYNNNRGRGNGRWGGNFPF